jgi:hypothetical protein
MKEESATINENDISEEKTTPLPLENNNNTFNRLKELQDLLNKESGLKGLCKE